MARSMSLSSPSLAPGAISPLAHYCARLILSRSGYTALSVHGKGPPSPIPPPFDKLTATSPSQNCRVLRRYSRRQIYREHRLVLPRTQRKGESHQELRSILQGNLRHYWKCRPLTFVSRARFTRTRSRSIISRQARAGVPMEVCMIHFCIL